MLDGCTVVDCIGIPISISQSIQGNFDLAIVRHKKTSIIFLLVLFYFSTLIFRSKGCSLF